MALDRSKIDEMTDEELQEFSENDDNHLYVDLDKDDDFNLDREYFYHDKAHCDACFTRTVLHRRESERESKKPGNLPTLYIPGKQGVIYQNVFISELERGDFAAYRPNPGSDKVEYMECLESVYDAHTDEYVTVWRRTNTTEVNPHYARYSSSDTVNVHRVLRFSDK